MIRFRRSALQVLLSFLVATISSEGLRGQSGSTLNGHPVRRDASGKLLAWNAVQGDAYDQVLGLATNYLLNGVPTASNGLKLYYTYSYANPGNPVTPQGWPHNPAGLYSMLTESGLRFYAYSGNAAMANLARDVLTYQLDHGMTPSTWNWPSVAYASSEAGALTYQGAQYGNSNGVGDGVGVIQPDKVGEIGVAFLKYYEFSGAVRFRDAAIQAASVLASHIRTGNATQSPWPFRVYAQTNAIREQYSAHVISPIQLFDELIRLNLGNVSAYQTARQTAWNWLMTYPIQNNAWANYFEDVPIRSDRANVNQLNAGETARYLMSHPEFDPNWETHVRGIIAWIEGTFAVPQFGANSIAEQDAFFFPMGSHTSRYASVNAQLYELTGDQTALEKAYRSLNWATYMCGSNGVVIDGPDVNHIWWTDGYGDYIKHFLEGLGSVPEWAPPSQSHLLRSTSVVRGVQYAPTEINYQVFDGSAREVLRLNFTPQSVVADGVALSNRADLAQQGWTFDPATGVLRIRHDAATQVRVSGSPTTANLPPVVSLDGPAPGNYVTSTLTLRASASDPDGNISRVDFYQNGAPLGTTTTAPYTFTWTSISPGTYQLTAVATDNQGASSTSALVQVGVSAPSPPPGPTNLVATFAGGTISLTWSPPVGAPGVVTYNIHRSNTSNFAPSMNNLVGQASSPPFLDRSLPAGTYYYRVVALDAIGTPSAASNEAAASVTGGLALDKIVISDGTGARTTSAFSTVSAREILLAFVASDGSSTTAQTATVSGGGVNWTLTRRVNAQHGVSEIWSAVATTALTNVTITATPAVGGYHQSLTVVTFTGASGVGASATANASSGAPTVSLTTTKAGSLVYGVGNDWDGAVARVPVANQVVVHQWVDTGAGDTLWVQATAAAIPVLGTVVQLSDSSPTTDRWNVGAVEITPEAPGPALVSVPDVVNQTQAAATALLTAPGVGLVVGTVTPTPSATAPSGSVITQSPGAGTPVAVGSAVNLAVSTGPATATGLVAALAFDENTGTGVTDSSGNGNAGTTSGTTWTTGQFGSALNFNGTSARVSIPDSNSLDLTGNMTLEAWVKPTTVNGWTTVILKEGTNGLSYGLYASDNTNRPPAGYVTISGDKSVVGPAMLPLNAWSHLAMTYNGSSMRLYVNGALVTTRAQTGNTAVSTGILRIGGNAVWGEYFSGAIDELRIYNRALSGAEIQADMNTRIRP